eukprot:scaffold18150_cov16-Prasinocladus_malaysianus.AAC.1
MAVDFIVLPVSEVISMSLAQLTVVSVLLFVKLSLISRCHMRVRCRLASSELQWLPVACELKSDDTFRTRTGAGAAVIRAYFWSIALNVRTISLIRLTASVVGGADTTGTVVARLATKCTITRMMTATRTTTSSILTKVGR